MDEIAEQLIVNDKLDVLELVIRKIKEVKRWSRNATVKTGRCTSPIYYIAGRFIMLEIHFMKAK